MIKKRFIVFLFCATMIMGNVLNVTAAETTQNTYEQEYFQWESGSVDRQPGLDSSIASIKDFTFKILASIESEPFDINKKSISIKSSADVMNIETNKIEGKYDGEKYKIELRSTKFPYSKRTFTFKVGSTETKKITDLKSGKYTIKVINTSMDLSPTPYRLVGNGSVF